MLSLLLSYQLETQEEPFLKQDFGIHSLFLIAIFIFFMVYELESQFKYFSRYTYYFICVQIKMM